MQYDHSPSKTTLKQCSGILDVVDDRTSKKQCMGPHEDDKFCVRYEIAGVVESLDRMAAEAREDRQKIAKMLKEVLDEIRRRS